MINVNLKDFKDYVIKNNKEVYDSYMNSLDNTERERERVILKSTTFDDFYKAVSNSTNQESQYNWKLDHSLWFKGWDNRVNYFINMQLFEDNSNDKSVINCSANFKMYGEYGYYAYKTPYDSNNIKKESKDNFSILYHDGDMRNYGNFIGIISYRPCIIIYDE